MTTLISLCPVSEKKTVLACPSSVCDLPLPRVADLALDDSGNMYDDGPEDDVDDVEEPEPLLKFKRIEGNLVDILAQDLATCLAVHTRYLVSLCLISL